jgi:hypothetical protein
VEECLLCKQKSLNSSPVPLKKKRGVYKEKERIKIKKASQGGKSLI